MLDNETRGAPDEKINDHDLLIRLDERVETNTNRIDETRDDLSELDVQYQSTVKYIAELVGGQLSGLNTRIADLEKQHIKIIAMYAVVAAIISVLLYVVVPIIIR